MSEKGCLEILCEEKFRLPLVWRERDREAVSVVLNSMLNDRKGTDGLYLSKQLRRYLWGIGARAPSSFGNAVHSAASAS